MTRIHEALRKAEEARDGSPVAADESATDKSLDPTSAVGGRVGERQQTISASKGRPENAKPAGIFSNGDKWENLTPSPWECSPHRILFIGHPAAAKGVESFRTLRTRLYLFRKQRPLQKILVSSALLRDGKTFIGANLGQALAQQGERVLLIDGDLRFSTLHESFGAPQVPGLTEYLKGTCEEKSIIQKGSLRNLFLIPGGSHIEDATELLTNGRMEGLLRRLSPDFDWIIFDSPPIVPVSDAKIIGELCDGVLIVIRSGSTSLTSALKACQEIGDNRLLGVVLNRVDPHSVDSPAYCYDTVNVAKP